MSGVGMMSCESWTLIINKSHNISLKWDSYQMTGGQIGFRWTGFYLMILSNFCKVILYCNQKLNMIEENSAQIDTKIGKVDAGSDLQTQQKEHIIEELKKSLTTIPRTDSSFKVITSIANTMIGSSIIVYPIMFIKDGIVGALLVLLAIGAALFATCRLLLIHNRSDEDDFGVSIKRILGEKWARLNSVVNIVLIFMVSLAYFMLICSNFFDITAAIIEEVSSYKTPESGTITLSTYSTQYASIISVLVVVPFIWRKDIEFLMKFFKFTIYLVFFYGLFVLISFIRVLADGSLDFSLYPKFDPDFSTVAGAFALSLLIHPVAAPILRRSAKPQKNMRNLFLGYCLTALIYVFVGFIGGLTCAKSVQDINEHPGKYQTIFDCFKKSDDSSGGDIFFFIFGKVVQLGIFVQNLSVMPILSFITRKEFLMQFKHQSAKKKAYIGYNLLILILSFAVTFFEVDVSIVLSLNGAIIGFFMAYGIPISLHLACYHKKMNDQQKMARTELLLSLESETDADTVDQALKCNEHPPRSKLRNFSLYGGLMGIGFAIGCFKIYAMFK